MSKRRCSQSLSEDEWNGLGEVYPSNSESDDWSYASKKAKQPTRKKSVAKKKRKTEVQTREMVQSSAGILEDRDSAHPVSRHSIQSPGPMRIALLQWFATVKDSRGMPWRKPSGFSQTPEERSQRAYEVMRMLILIPDEILFMGRCGYLRLCCNKLRLQRLYLTTIAGWKRKVSPKECSIRLFSAS